MKRRGGGAISIELGCLLRKKALRFSNQIQLAINSFADALEVIPLTLARNGYFSLINFYISFFNCLILGGFDASKIISELRFIHQQKEGIWYGVDMENGVAANMMEKNVLEPSIVLQSAILYYSFICFML